MRPAPDSDARRIETLLAEKRSPDSERPLAGCGSSLVDARLTPIRSRRLWPSHSCPPLGYSEHVREAGFGIYGATDPRELPRYRVAEAAHYLLVPQTTLRAWAFGQKLSAGKRFLPVLGPVPRGQPLLSFFNLVEAHVLSALRVEHEISLQKVRSALLFLQGRYPARHPLIDNSFMTDGLDLFVEKYGELINASRHGQLGMRDVLMAYLRRIERDASGLVARLFPFTRLAQLDQPAFVVIDPCVSFGRPVIRGTAIPTAIIKQRYKAGDSIKDLAGDYDRREEEIEEAIRLELAA